MKIILSRKGFDDKYGGMASVIWPDSREMLSFPIPVEITEDGVSSHQMHFNDRSLSGILGDLGYNEKKQGAKFHLDPEIQNLTNEFTFGSFGQSGSALGHLKNKKIGTGDIFLFFGTYCETYLEERKICYQLMHPFHAIWGYLVVDQVIENVELISDNYFAELKLHPHYLNKDKKQYKKGNYIYIGKQFGTFRYRDILRLTKIGYKKSYWSLPVDFNGLSMSHNEDSMKPISDGRLEFKAASIGQEFVIDNAAGKLNSWLERVLECKNHQGSTTEGSALKKRKV